MTTTKYAEFKNKIEKNLPVSEIYENKLTPPTEADPDKIRKIRIGGQSFLIEEYSPTNEITAYVEVDLNNITEK